MLGERLKQLRLQNNKTHKDISAMLMISRQAYGFYENEKRSPDYETLKKLANYYNVSMAYLLGETDERNFGQASTVKEKQEPYNSDLIDTDKLSSLEKHLFKSYMSLDYDIRQKLVAHFKEAFDTYIEEDATQKEIEAELARYRLELEAEKLGKTSSASGGRKRSLG